ncbi:MAG: hypothetical protein ACFE0P_07205 [Oceanicaulis sp.]
MLTLRGKRWLYDIGGRRVSVENAWSWTGWAQERVVVDGESVRETGEEMKTRRRFTVPVEETRLNAPLEIDMRAKGFWIDCRMRYGDELIEPIDVQYGNWRGERGDWPPAELSGVAGSGPVRA